MDVERIRKESADFCKEGDAYIHTEMKCGKSPQTVLCGDIMGMLWCVGGELHRISEITHTSFDDCLNMTAVLHEEGYKAIRKKAGDEPFKQFETEDWYKKAKDKAEKEANIKAHNLEVDIKNLKESIKTLEKINKNLAVEKQRASEQHTKDVAELNKKIRKLEKENDELCKKIEWGRKNDQ